MKESILRTKAFAFAMRIVKLCRYLQKEKKEYNISGQLFRSGTSVGALHRESEYAESKADFIHKLAIAQKELNESIYWLELLQVAELITKVEFDSMIADADELMKIISSSILTSKQSLIKQKESSHALKPNIHQT